MIINLFGFYFNVFEVVLLSFLVIILPAYVLRYGYKIKITDIQLFHVFLISSVLYITFILISTSFASSEMRVLKAFFKWIEILVFSFLIFFYVRDFKNFKKIYWLFWFSNFCFIIVSILNVIKNPGSLIVGRILSDYPAVYGLALLIPFIKFKKNVTIVFAAIFFLSALFSMTRGVWVVLIIYSILLFIKTSFQKRLFIFSFFLILSLLLIKFTPIIEVIQLRINTKSSNSERMGMAEVALKAFSEKPFTGIGSLNFPIYLQQNADHTTIYSTEPEKLEPHNVLLQVAAEEGVFALLTFSLMIIILIYKIFNHKFSLSGAGEKFDPYLNGLKFLSVPVMAYILFGFISDSFRFVLIMFIGLTLSLFRLSASTYTKFN
ncbi:O-antigen ligase family protein [candidate division KSB1 bacterium]|nr:O-antigen ligase family protein [candidate division KSB1 bacterium]